MSTQVIARSLAQAVEQAIKLSLELGYSAIVLYRGEYHVQTDSNFANEEVIAEYNNGNLVNGY